MMNNLGDERTRWVKLAQTRRGNNKGNLGNNIFQITREIPLSDRSLLRKFSIPHSSAHVLVQTFKNQFDFDFPLPQITMMQLDKEK